MRRTKMLALLFALALSGCGEAPDTAPLNPHAARDLAAVTRAPHPFTKMRSGEISAALPGANQSCAIKRRHFVRLLVG